MNEVAIRLKKLFLDAGLSKEVTAGLLGNIEIESNFIPRSESLKYSSVARIKEVFPNKVKGMTDSQIGALVMNEKALGDVVYADLAKETVNGKEVKYSGYDFRGRGFIQITGIKNYRQYSNILKVDLVKNPNLACDEMIAGKIAIEYIKTVAFKAFPNINQSKDLNYVIDCITKSIQGVGKDYVNNKFLREHLEKKRKAGVKYYD